MTVHELINDLRRLNVRLWLEEGALRFSAPRDAMDSSLRERIQTHRPALLELLATSGLQQETPAPALPEDADADADAQALSFAQQRLLFLHRMDPQSPAYHLPTAMRIRGPLDVAALQHALRALTARHDALRTCFPTVGSAYVRHVQPDATLVLETASLRGQPQALREAALTAFAEAEARRLFDIEQAPLLRACLVDVDSDDHALLLTMHHAISDGWSVDLIQHQLWAEYAHPGSVPPTAFRSDAYVNWQRNWLESMAYRAQKTYWLERLAHAPELIELPVDRPRPPVQQHAGALVLAPLPSALLRKASEQAARSGVSMYMLLLAGFVTLLHKLTGSEDLALGTPIANRRQRAWEDAVGFISNVVVLRVPIAPDERVSDLLARTRDISLAAQENQEFPFEQVVEHLQQKRSLSYSPVFQVMFMMRDDAESRAPAGLDIETFQPATGVAKFDLTLNVQMKGDSATLALEYDTALFDAGTVQRIAGQYLHLLSQMVDDPERTIAGLSPLDAAARAQIDSHSHGPQQPLEQPAAIHGLILKQAHATPDLVAIRYYDEQMTYAQLAERAAAVAGQLQAAGIGAEDRVGIFMQRGPAMVVALLGTLLAGAAYVPLDPEYPAGRLSMIADDADLKAVVTSADLRARVPRVACPAVLMDELPEVSSATLELADTHGGHGLAYVIYTSGSTGTPKGVMVTHANAVNLFDGLDRSLAPSLALEQGRPVWLALTSISFDISVLELLWTLARGHQVILQKDHLTALSIASGDATALPAGARRSDGSLRPAPAFSLFYFASDEDQQQDKYRLLMDGARFADENGFAALWVPERHFHAFGGQFPNPALAAAAVAAVTQRIQIRAGSCVLPLHDPIRVAEEWSMVDNLSAGRAGVAFASGWHFNDFVLAPDRFQQRHAALREGIDTVRTLWGGGSIKRTDGLGNEVDISVRPRPVQPTLPIWITAAASPDTFRYAGEIGANVLTHLLGQSLGELKEKIALYRQARQEHGHDPDSGQVTLMLHTFVGEDLETVRNVVREPFKNYLRSSINLLKPVAESQGLDAGDDLELVVEAGFNRYFASSALFGTPDSCQEMIRQVAAIGVDEIGCLIDFGVDVDEVAQSLPTLAKLRMRMAQPAPEPALNLAEAATHLQCTPSFARMLLEQPGVAPMLGNLRGFLVGGEALPPSLCEQLQSAVGGAVFNMYGPTETTVWSSVQHIDDQGARLGPPISNTSLHVLDTRGERVPIGVNGELYIGGEGVARGYLGRPGLTAERFVPDPYSTVPGARLYRTGDLVRRYDNGTLEYIARLDNQVKVRGYRVELGEVEAALQAFEGVKEAIAIVRPGDAGDAVLHAFVVAAAGAEIDIAGLQAHLATHLPDYMRPSALQELQQMPLTPNGKVDRNRLPELATAGRRETGQLPRNALEQMLSDIWCELLGLEAVSVDENFFQLGGHSLLLGRLQQRIAGEFGQDIGIIELFKYPTISSLTAMLAREDQTPRFQKAAKRSKDSLGSINRMRERMKQRKQHGSH